jgi:hypothetical protein
MRIFEYATTWSEHHTAGATLLTTTAPDTDAGGADVGLAFVFAFLAAIAIVFLGKIVLPLAQVVQVLAGAFGALALIVASVVLMVVLLV